MAKSQDDSLQTVGVILSERVYAGLIVGHKLNGELISYPSDSAASEARDDDAPDDSLIELPTESIVKAICRVVSEVAKGNEKEISSVGIALPGLIRNGVVEEAPNLPQLKGARIQELVLAGLAEYGISATVCVLNDADAMAAGLASQHDKLDHFIRVWTLGTGIGYGRYPFAEGVWEGGHSVVTLDEKETYCGCGGRGHMEGIMGHRSMRLRFLDLEPEEVFEAANRRENPDSRCLDFKRLWHKALAAATASSIHMAGSGKFFITGYNVRFLDLKMLKDYLHQMVKMSPIQGYSIEVVEDAQLSRVIGAAVAAEQAHGR
jgi:predicted NBD/HSP70 family sugar kinase